MKKANKNQLEVKQLVLHGRRSDPPPKLRKLRTHHSGIGESSLITDRPRKVHPAWLRQQALFPIIPEDDELLRALPNEDEMVRLFKGECQRHSHDCGRLLFWCGVEAKDLMSYAENHKMLTIGDVMPPTLYKFLIEDQVDFRYGIVWSRISSAFAHLAQDQVTVLVDDEKVAKDPRTIWNSYERPVLFQRDIKVIWKDIHNQASPALLPDAPRESPWKPTPRGHARRSILRRTSLRA